MPKRPFYSHLTALLLAVLLAIQPLCTPPVLDLFLGNNHKTAHAAPPAQGSGGSLFLPIILNNAEPGGQGGDAPDFVINSPINGSAVGGVTFFAIQPTNGATIDRVTFRAGATDLGADTTAGDGFRVFLNARNLPAGATELTATASGPGGETTKSINVTIVPNPPQSATIGTAGGVLASEIGSVISLLPGSVSAGTTVTVDELTQAETTTRHGINWESMGVTFLGAQDVQASAPISGPFGMVASAGFGNRVQPGQAVVNYRIAPDADGDGADEIVVVNTASVAPNGDVVADPIRQVTIAEQNSAVNSRQVVEKSVTISGPPGKPISLRLSGLNFYSFAGNTARFRSLVSNAEVTVVGQVDYDTENPNLLVFRVGMPYFPIGAGTLTIQNLSTGYESEPISIQIEPLPPLTRPAKLIFEEYFQKYHFVLDEAKVKVDQNPQLKALTSIHISQAITNITSAQKSMQQVYSFLETTPIPTVERFLEDAAKMIEVSAILQTSSLQRNMISSLDGCEPPENLSQEEIKKGLLSIIPIPFIASPSIGEDIDPVDVAGTAAEAAGHGTLGTVINSASSGWKIASFQKKLFDNINNALDYANNQSQGKCKDQPPPPPNSGNNGSGSGGGSGGAITGMGSAPPPGGNGFGGSGSGRGGRQVTAAGQQQTSPVMVKIFSNGNRTPFTGMTDPGGYFFVPFIPAGEPFTALAIDTATGDTRSFTGIGPATGESVFMFFDFFYEEAFVPSIQWDGGGDGRSWHDPLNWNPDQIPAASDRVLIDVPGEPTITFARGDRSIVSLQSAEKMEFTGGVLTIGAKSTISGALTLRNGFALSVDGLGASLTATGATIAAGAHLTARNGGRIVLPQLTRVEGDGGDFFTTLRAEGANSLLDLSAVTLLEGNTFVNDSLNIEAANGGKINLSRVAAITVGKVQFTATGQGSEIDLSALTRFTRGGRGGSLLAAMGGGAIIAPKLTELRGVGLTLDGTGTLATAQITIFTGGNAEVTDVTPDFSGMTDVDGSSFMVKGGGKVTLPKVTSYAGDGEGSDFFTTLEVEGVGSQLDLSTITTLEGNTFVNDALIVTAKSGGKIDLRNLNKIEVGKVQFKADGNDSLIDLSTLTRFGRSGRGGSGLEAIFNGTILVNQLTELRGIALLLDGTGTLATGQITIFTGGRAEVTATTPDFNNMSTVDGSSFIVKGGGKVFLPKITSYAGDGEESDFFTTMEVEGAGSVLDLSKVATLAGNTFVNDSLVVKAASGGQINLSSVTQITQGKVQFTAENSGSLIDLSALTNFARSGRGDSFMQVADNGKIDMKTNTVTMGDVHLILEENGSYTAGTFQLDGESALRGKGALPINIINNGSVAPGNNVGQLQINGTYAQSITGTLTIQINGKTVGTEFDQLQVTGNATLNGALTLDLGNNYSPAIGDSFVILTAGSISGAFTTVDGTVINNGKKFQVQYGATTVTLQVVPQ